MTILYELRAAIESFQLHLIRHTYDSSKDGRFNDYKLRMHQGKTHEPHNR